MTSELYLDPLAAAAALLDHIIGNEACGDPLNELAARIDAFMYALRFLRIDAVNYIQDTDAIPPKMPPEHWRETIDKRFSRLGLYWSVSTRMIPGKDFEIFVGDAINDLSDIARELSDVLWYSKNFGRDEALAALRCRYEHHLNMHLMPLRAHLEEEIFELY